MIHYFAGSANPIDRDMAISFELIPTYLVGTKLKICSIVMQILSPRPIMLYSVKDFDKVDTCFFLSSIHF